MEEIKELMKLNPIATVRSRRVDNKRVLTSGNAGKILPIAYIPMLREDALVSGRMRISFEMMETAEQLMNGVNVQVNAHFVPWLAFDRFEGSMDRLNRAYGGQPAYSGGAVTPWFTQAVNTADFSTNQIMKTLGVHTRAGKNRNQAVWAAYNQIVNLRRKLRSPLLPLRAESDTTLAEAFWQHNAMKHIVADFDQARVDGEVALNVVSANLPVRGIGNLSPATTAPAYATAQTVYEVDGSVKTYPNAARTSDGIDQLINYAQVAGKWVPQIFAEMQQNGITVSLSNIDMAKKVAAFARMREEFQGVDDQYLIDMLMSGVAIPELALQQPILMAQKNTLFGYSTRFASDAANLDESVTVGQTFIDLDLRLPRMNTGGIIMITAEIVPEQLFERGMDWFVHATQVAELPDYLRDFLDPEKVAVVPCEHVDMDHTTPAATFGYAPLNHQWMRDHANIGGKFYRPHVNASFDQDRQRIWAVETVDPQLTRDFYMCTQMHQKVFADTVADAFEILARGRFVIEGNTVFGPALTESVADEYDLVMAKVPQARIVKP